jgi:hypothetical protein
MPGHIQPIMKIGSERAAVKDQSPARQTTVSAPWISNYFWIPFVFRKVMELEGQFMYKRRENGGNVNPISEH